MSIEKRKHQRIKANLKIEYEFVKWNEKFLTDFKKPFSSTTYDISISGLGVKKLDGLTDKILKKLEKGKLKVKLAIYLEKGKPPILTFARLIWANTNESNGLRLGFLFIDVTEEFLVELSTYIEKHKN